MGVAMEYTAQQHMILIGIEDAWGLARLKEVMIGKQLVSLPSSITRKHQEKKKKNLAWQIKATWALVQFPIS